MPTQMGRVKCTVEHGLETCSAVQALYDET